jgi:hypothetical protein
MPSYLLPLCLNYFYNFCQYSFLYNQFNLSPFPIVFLFLLFHFWFWSTLINFVTYLQFLWVYAFQICLNIAMNNVWQYLITLFCVSVTCYVTVFFCIMTGEFFIIWFLFLFLFIIFCMSMDDHLLIVWCLFWDWKAIICRHVWRSLDSLLNFIALKYSFLLVSWNAIFWELVGMLLTL